MVTDIKQPLTKDLLQREHIRTMKKDLASLREADSMEEKQKIRNIKVPNEEPVEIIPPPSQPVTLKQSVNKADDERENNIQAVLEALEKEEKLDSNSNLGSERVSIDQAKVKEYASEAEKQQIFLFQSQKADLEKQLELLLGSGNSPVDLQKDKMLSERKDWQEKLEAMSEQQLNATKEEQRQDIEKKRWLIEAEIKKIDDNVKNITTDFAKSQEKQTKTKQELANIENSLKTIYNSILLRVGTSKQTPKPQAPVTPVVKQEPPKIPTKIIMPDKEFLRGVTTQAREKLEASTQVEEKQRVKFMDDVEKWIASSQNKNN